MKTVEEKINEKLNYLKTENEILKSFRNEMVMYFTSKANDEIQPYVAKTVKKELSGSLNNMQNTLSGSLNTLKMKNNLISAFMLILQVVILLIFFFNRK
ncbi:MAG: hypothetical protein IKZ88_07130 [Neisseriaceae bacterium]|nr:hypothetical protein [Neisseriaceae bacterium]